MTACTRRTVLVAALAFVAGVTAEASAKDKKYTTEVTVYNKEGKPSKGRKVVLEVSGGFTDDYYTDDKGVAKVKHASTGTAKVYVDGDHSSHKTTVKAPGSVSVYLTK